MKIPDISIDNLDIKLSLGGTVLNVLFVKSGYFYTPMPEHSHSQGSYELHYIPTGKGILNAQGKRYAVVPGTLFVTGPGIVHEQIPDPEDPMAEYCIFFEIWPGSSYAQQNKPSLLNEPVLSELLVSNPFWIGQDSGEMFYLFEILAKEITLPQIGAHHMVINLLEMILIRSLRHYQDNQASIQPLPLKTLDDNRLLVIENCFLFRYSSITLKQIADQVGLSTRQTERVIYKQYGMSFQDKKLQARMIAASRLLLTTEASISEIATQAGYQAPEPFSNAFKKYYSMTATQYRKESSEKG